MKDFQSKAEIYRTIILAQVKKAIQLKHQNIVQLKQWVVAYNNLYLIYEQCEASLRQRQEFIQKNIAKNDYVLLLFILDSMTAFRYLWKQEIFDFYFGIEEVQIIMGHFKYGDTLLTRKALIKNAEIIQRNIQQLDEIESDFILRDENLEEGLIKLGVSQDQKQIFETMVKNLKFLPEISCNLLIG